MKNTILILILISLFSCNSKSGNCRDLPSGFSSYNDAINSVESVDFKIEDEVDTSKSSWIRSAKYYSCDGRSGYLIYSTDKQEYIHQGVPLEIWEGFKNAESFGKFYNANIKNKYQMISKK